MRKSRKQQLLDDAAWERAQQIDIETQGVADAGLSAASSVQRVNGVPTTCPGCGKRMTLDSGWTVMAYDGEHHPLQCGACGKTIAVPASAWDGLREQLRHHFALRALALTPPKPRRERRERGAG